MITEVTTSAFEQEVLKSDKPVLVEFWASWCGPCKMIAPVVSQLSEEHEEVKFCKVNVDNETQIAAKYGIMSIPTLIMFENGEMVKQHMGVAPKAKLEAIFF